MIAVLCLLLLAPSPAPSPRPTPAPPSLQGVVVDPAGKPVRDAVVRVRAAEASLTPQPVSVARTDEAGRFKFVLKSARLVDVRVSAAGWAPADLRRTSPTAPLRVTLREGAVIEGVVRDAASGQPVAGAALEALEENTSRLSSPDDPDLGAQAKSDAEGRFRLSGLQPVRHTVTAFARGFGRAAHPNVAPAPPTAKPGARRPVELFLHPGSGVAGTVRDEAGEPVAGAVVRAWRAEMGGPRSDGSPTRSSRDGSFELLGLENGTYHLYAVHAGHALAVAPNVSVDAGGARVDLRLARGTAIVGRLVDDGARSARGIVRLETMQDVVPHPHLRSLFEATAEGDGRFRLEGIPPGPVVLRVEAPGFVIRRVDADVPVPPASGERPPLDLGDVPLEAGAALRGRVHDAAGQPVEGARVWGQPMQPSGGSFGVETTTTADGTFTLAAAPGRFRLGVRAEGYALANTEAQTGEPVDVTLVPEAVITGTVLGPGGEMVPTFSVTAQPLEERDWMSLSRGERGNEGRFRMGGLGADTWALQVSAPDLLPATVSDVQTRTGQTVDVGIVRLSAGGRLRGSVVDPAGAPVRGARISVERVGQNLWMGDEPTTTSDGEGRFELNGVPTGRHEVLGRHPAWADGRVEDVNVTPDGPPAEVRVVMRTGGRIEGTVRWRQPVAAWVMAGDFRGPRGDVQPDGSFVVERVPAGPTRVRLMLRSGPGSTSTKVAMVEVPEGGTATVDFTLREIRVSGRVLGPDGPVSDAFVRFHHAGGGAFSSYMMGALPDARGPQRHQATSGPDGAYELLVDEPGVHSISVTADGGRIRYTQRQAVIPDVDAHILDIQVEGATLAGVVVEAESEAPIADAQIGVRAADGGKGAFVGTRSGPDGRFEVRAQPGRHTLYVSARGRVAEQRDVELDAGGADIRIALDRGQQLRGRVLDARGGGVGSAMVTVVRPDRSGENGTEASPDGSFLLDDLGPGPFNLLAGTDSVGWGVLTGLQPGVAPVVVSVQPPGTLEVLATSAGRPVESLYAEIVGLDGAVVSAWHPPHTTAATGGVRRIVLPSGRVTVRLQAPGMKPAELTMDLAPGGSEAREIAMEAVPAQ